MDRSANLYSHVRRASPCHVEATDVAKAAAVDATRASISLRMRKITRDRRGLSRATASFRERAANMTTEGRR